MDSATFSSADFIPLPLESYVHRAHLTSDHSFADENELYRIHLLIKRLRRSRVSSELESRMNLRCSAGSDATCLVLRTKITRAASARIQSGLRSNRSCSQAPFSSASPSRLLTAVSCERRTRSSLSISLMRLLDSTFATYSSTIFLPR